MRGRRCTKSHGRFIAAEQADIARGQPPPGPQQHIAFVEVEAFAADVAAARRTFEHADAIAARAACPPG